MMEHWAPVPWRPDAYEVSDTGVVKSLARIEMRGSGKSLPVKECILKQTGNRYGHRTVTILPKGAVGVHTLVMEAFVGPCPAGMEVCHLDGDATNNSISNLAYVTHQENCGHRVVHGTQVRGSAHPVSKLTDNDVVDMRWLRAMGVKSSELGALFGVSARHVRKVCSGQKWAHI